MVGNLLQYVGMEKDNRVSFEARSIHAGYENSYKIVLDLPIVLWLWRPQNRNFYLDYQVAVSRSRLTIRCQRETSRSVHCQPTTY